MNNFVKRRMDWLDKVVADHSQRRLPLAVAVKLVTTYFNAETGTAWPGTRRLAEDLNVDRRNLRRALDQLVAGGHLRREREKDSHGRDDTNLYSMRVREGGCSTPLGGSRTVRKGGPERSLRGAERPPEPKKNPRRTQETSRARENQPEDSGNQTNSDRSTKSSSPYVASGRFRLAIDSSPVLSETDAAEALRIAGWDRNVERVA